MKRRTHWPVLATALLLGACTSLPVELGSRSSQTLPPKNASVREIQAQACGWRLLLIGHGIRNHAARAYQDLLAQAQGDYIAEVQVEQSWTNAIVYRQWCTQLKAKAYHAAR